MFWRKDEPAPEEAAPMDLRRLRDELQRLPTDPVSRSHPRNWLFRFKRGLDFIGHARPTWARFFRMVNPYPKPFRHVRFETADGVAIAAWYGPPDEQGATSGPEDPDEALEEEGRKRDQRGGARRADPGPAGTPDAGRDARDAPHRAEAGQARPQPGSDHHPFGLVVVPGMFSTKDDTVHKRRTIWLRRHWNIPVLCIDTRAFGESTGIATGGWKESYDIHAAAKWLRAEAGVERVGVLCESMGAAAALNALAYDEESGERILNGGTLCFSAFVDLYDAVHYISTEPPKDDPYYTRWAGFRKLLKFKSHGGYERFDEYLEDAARVNGLEGFQDIVDVANPKWKTSLIKAPTLLVHATDDPVVPVRHARRMERYARDHPNIQVVIKDFGEHTGFEAMAPWWFWEVACRFFGAVNHVRLQNPVGDRRVGRPEALSG